MDPRNRWKNPNVSRGEWCVGTLSGTGIEGCILQPFRPLYTSPGVYRRGKDRNPLSLKGQLYGLNITEPDYDKRNEIVDALFRLYGYSQPYGRNICEFVQSRAARRRGYKTTDGRYLRRAAEGKREPIVPI